MTTAASLSDLVVAALNLAAQGFRVFPCHEPRRDGCTCRDDRKCTSKGKHPRTEHGVKDGTTDDGTIRAWWARWPTANIGIATGNGVMVLDVDPRHGGSTVGLELPDTLRVVTGGGGEHWYFQVDQAVPNSAGLIGDGLDVRGEGGYVIAPPSLHECGKAYEWDAGAGDSMAKAPGWLEARARSKRASTVIANDTTGEPDAFVAGGRNNSLFSLGCSMRDKSFGREAILAALLAENARRCRPVLDELEVRRIAESTMRYEAKRSPDGKDPFDWRYCDDLLCSELGSVPWVVEGLQIGPGRPCGVWGYGGSGKSWWAMAMALAVVSGKDFLGFHKTRQGAVRHLSHEMGLRTLKERYRRLANGMSLGVDAIADRLAVSAYPRVYLNSDGAERCYVDALQGVTLAIFDSLRRALPGEDENDSSISNYLDMLGRVSNETGCTCVVLHHSGKAALDANRTEKRGAGRGSSAIEDGSSCIWLIEGKDAGPRLCTHTRIHEESEGILEPFYIDMTVGSVGLEYTFQCTRGPVTLHTLSNEEAKVIQRRALIKGNVEAYRELVGRIRQAVKDGARSKRALRTAVGDSKKIRAVIGEMIDDHLLEETAGGLVCGEMSDFDDYGGDFEH